MRIWAVFSALASLPFAVQADLPVHCVHHQVEGSWEFFLGPASARRSSCGHQSPDAEDKQPPVALIHVSEKKTVHLRSPDRAFTSGDIAGRWTMIYDEGFEVNVDGLSFFAFSRFDVHRHGAVKTNVSRCGETQLGWYHNQQRTQWGCFFAKKLSVPEREEASLLSFAPARPAKAVDADEPLGEEYHNSFVAALNTLQDWWTAKVHDRWVGRSLREMNSMAGIFRPFSISEQRAAARIHGPESSRSSVSFVQRFQERRRTVLQGDRDNSLDITQGALPAAWDWRNVSGKNYLDMVVDQGECGSCYAVATTHMLSARHRIRQGDPEAEGFSAHFPLFCSEYNQGCDGGYAFLVSRWSQDVGLVPKSCAPYTGTGRCELKCDVAALKHRFRAANHHYVGGYYGAATEKEMMHELVRDGPLVASFEPKADLMYYNGGIYSSVPNKRTEWERVDHAVLLVGYGEERGQKYWILQNSWGQSWGEDGFFRMVRGSDESGIESIVVAADVVEETRPAVLLDFVAAF